MKITYRLLLLISIVLMATPHLMASGQVGIYGVISKVVFEPNDKTPERIQIWGAFTLVDGGTGSGGKTLTPQRGYLYFTLQAASSPVEKEVALKEWADFKAVAGTGQAVAFGRIIYIGAFSDELISRPAGMPPYLILGGAGGSGSGGASKNIVRAESVAPSAPDIYPLNMGLTKLSSTGNLAAVVKELQNALK